MRRQLNLGLRVILIGAAIVLAYQQLPAIFNAWDTEQPTQWWAARATGFLTYVALTLSMVFGLMVSSRGLDGGVARGTVLEHHQQWTLAAMIALVAHVLVIVTDDFSTITVVGALVPGQSSELTGPVALGAVAFWAVTMITVSSWLRAYMPFIAWRIVHTAALGGFVIGLVHGVTAGTDTDLPAAQALYVITASAVIGAMIFRFLYVAHRRHHPVSPPAT